LQKNIQVLMVMPPSQFTEAVKNVPEIALYALDCLRDEPDFKTQICNFLTFWRNYEPITTGDTLKSLGIPPGPRYASILTELKHARLDGKINNKTQEQEYLDQLIQNL